MSRHLGETRCVSPALPIASLETELLARIGKEEGKQAPGDTHLRPRPRRFPSPFCRHRALRAREVPKPAPRARGFSGGGSMVRVWGL